MLGRWQTKIVRAMPGVRRGVNLAKRQDDFALHDEINRHCVERIGYSSIGSFSIGSPIARSSAFLAAQSA